MDDLRPLCSPKSHLQLLSPHLRPCDIMPHKLMGRNPLECAKVSAHDSKCIWKTLQIYANESTVQKPQVHINCGILDTAFDYSSLKLGPIGSCTCYKRYFAKSTSPASIRGPVQTKQVLWHSGQRSLNLSSRRPSCFSKVDSFEKLQVISTRQVLCIGSKIKVISIYFECR